MKIPQLQKKPEVKSCHNKTWEDNYSWIHQKNILDVLKDSSKLLPETRRYLEQENAYFEHKMKKAKGRIQKLRLFILGRAISGAPTIIGTSQFAKPTNAGITAPNTIINP